MQPANQPRPPDPTRAALAKARRIVVKLGSRVLVQRTGRPDLRRLRGLVRDLARLRRAGREVVVVTSGAIGAGMQALGMSQRPARLPDLQMAAAVGQSRLMRRYDDLFAREHCLVGQVLLTHDDLKHRARHLNARHTMLAMLRAGVIPIVNENDVVAVDEIKFGDNDLLASLVVQLVQAELLILLTTTDGLRARVPGGRTRRVPGVAAVTSAVLGLAAGKGSALSTGGMASKLESARAAAQAGAAVVIADGRRAGILGAILAGADTGTLIPADAPAGPDALTGRKRWIAFFHRAQGTLLIDDGARRALEQGGKSLLAIGIRAVEGAFEAGAAVDIRALDRTLIARGLASYSGREIRVIQGRRSSAVAALLGAAAYGEVVHRDNLVLLPQPGP